MSVTTILEALRRPIWLAILIAICSSSVNHLPVAFATSSSPTSSSPLPPPSISTSSNASTRSVSVTLRGQKYQVDNVTTVQELQDKVTVLSGVSPSQQGRVIFGGQRLQGDTVLAEAGVPLDGAHINMVPSTTTTAASASSSSSSSSSAKSTKKASKKKKTAAAAATQIASTTATPSSSSTSSSSDFMIDMFKQSGLDKDALAGMMKGLGGGGGADDSNNSMEAGFKAMTDAMNSPLFQQMMGDPERLEQSRQMILNNPMLKSMMSGMPGMDDILNDPVAWRQAMQAAAELYKSMDTDTLMKAMMGGATDAFNSAAASGSNNNNPGLFDGTLDDKSMAALNELDEDD